MNKQGFLLTTLCFFFITVARTQTDYDWWVNTHHWDGITHWYQYLKMSPEYLGPNALPVPEIQKGVLDEKGFIEIAAEDHFGTGDQTQNIFTKLYFPIVHKKVAFEGYVVPIEHYSYDTNVRDYRVSRDRDGKGSAGGDIYFSTLIQIIRERKFPDVALRLAFRTASGTNCSAVRYTDAPGYFFDISFGSEKKYSKNSANKFRWYTMLGFYSWQTNSPEHRQDDAFLYGAGMDFDFGSIRVSPGMAGYFGYINNDDRPLVGRINFMNRKGKHYYGIQLQKGFCDFPFTSVKLYFYYRLPDKLQSGSHSE